MDASQGRVDVPGSDRAAVPGARPAGAVDPYELVDVTVAVRPGPGPRRDSDPADLARVKAVAERHGLTVPDEDMHPERHSLTVRGTVAALGAFFGADLRRHETPDGVAFRQRTGTISVPAELEGIVTAVLGLDDRPQARAHFRRLEGPQGIVRPSAAGSSFTPPQVARIYDFPTGADGTGQTIGIVELGGGYRPEDLQAYFQGLGLPTPQVSSVPVDGGQNSPTTPDGADGEVMLDLEVAGSIAPGARLVAYFAPNTDRGFYDAVATAVHDAANAPSVISISWGGPEPSWTAQAMRAMDVVFADAVAAGINVFVASGDSGSGDGLAGANVDFPASSPNVVACGGTRLTASDGARAAEVAWNDPGDGATGGGVSAVFNLPAWQEGAGVPGGVHRGVPDVAGDASPQSGYQVRVDGRDEVIGGTSAVAPLWAGLAALLGQRKGGRLAFLNPTLYGPAAAAGALHDITQGDNGAFSAAAGWDACTGLGSPDGAKLLPLV